MVSRGRLSDSVVVGDVEGQHSLRPGFKAAVESGYQAEPWVSWVLWGQALSFLLSNRQRENPRQNYHLAIRRPCCLSDPEVAFDRPQL